jgi:hypothetical protein
MDEQKRSVSVDITKHVRKFINFAGDEITREEALGIKKAPTINKPKVGGDKDGDNKGA